MSIVSFEINDFRLGVIGAKRIGSGDSSTPYEGFLKMEETVLVGTSITKRPPLKYITRTIDNVPKNNQFLSYGEFLFYAVGKDRAFIIEDGERVSTYPDVYTITNFAEENVYDVVVLDKKLDTTKGEFILAFIGQQPLEVYSYEEVTGQTNTYHIYSLSANKGYAPNNIESFKQVVVKSIPNNDYIDSVGGTYVTGGNKVGFTIAPDGTITANTLQADSITMVGSELVIATSAATGISVNFITTNGTSALLALVKEMGTVVYWIRAVQSALILSSDMGVFLLILDGHVLKNIMKIDDKTSSVAKPLLFKQYIIYVDNSGESLSYIRTSFANSYVAANAIDLAIDNDLFIGRGGIKKLMLYYYNNNPNIVALTNDGSCIVGQLNENVRETEVLASLAEWFVPYFINDIAIYRQSSANNRMTLSATFEGLTMLCALNAPNPPLFNREPELVAYADFYSDIQTSLIFNINQILFFTRIDDGSSLSFRCVANENFFKTSFAHCIVSDGMVSFRVFNILSPREAICELQPGTALGGDEYVMHAGTYTILFDYMSNLNHLYYLMFNQQKNRLYGYVDNKPIKFNFNYETGGVAFVYCSRLIVGLAYDMVLCTAQLLPFGFANRVRSGNYNNLQITTQTLGYNETYFFIGTSDGLLQSSNEVTTQYIEFKKPYKFINNKKINVPAVATNALLLYLSSDAVSAPFISNISVIFNYENT